MKEILDIRDYTYNDYNKKIDKNDELYSRVYGFSSQGNMDNDYHLSKYRMIASHINGYSIVRNKKRYYGVIDKDNNEVIPCLFEHIKQFSNGIYAIKNADGNYAFITIDGEMLTDFDYCDINYEFKEGLLAVAKRYNKNDKSKCFWGFIDENGKEVIPCHYSRAKDFSEGYASVLVNTNNTKSGKKFGYIDKSDNMVIPPQFDDALDFQCGRARITSLINNKYGFIDKNGKEVTPIKYHGARTFNDGLAAVQLHKDGKWGYINTDGKLVIPYKFDSAFDFENGFAQVFYKGYKQYIDKKGKILFDIRVVYKMKDGLHRIKDKNYKYGFMNKNGEIIISCEYDKAHNFSEGMALVQKAEQCGYVNTEGKVIIPIEYYFGTDYQDGFCQVYDPEDWNNKCFDKEGNLLEKIIYCSDITTDDGVFHVESTSKKGLAYKKAAILEEIREEYVKNIDENIGNILKLK